MNRHPELKNPTVIVYTFQDSIRDNATLPLHFEPRLVVISTSANDDFDFKQRFNYFKMYSFNPS